jgi:hypothetical protein
VQCGADARARKEKKIAGKWTERMLLDDGTTLSLSEMKNEKKKEKKIWFVGREGWKRRWGVGESK